MKNLNQFFNRKSFTNRKDSLFKINYEGNNIKIKTSS